MNTANDDDRRENTLRSDENKSPEHLEREVDEARARVGRSANELSDRLSPGELLDQALGMAREHAGEFGRNLGAQVKSNPLPMILTSVGISWMMMSSGKDAGSNAYKSYNASTDQGGRNLKNGMKSDLKNGLNNGSDNGLVGDLKEGLGDFKEGLGDAARKTADKAHEMGDRFHDATSNVKHSAHNARENLAEFYREQPLIAGSIGIAIGAALGALVPSTEIEDDMFGHARDQSLDAAKSTAARKYDEVRESARDLL